MNRFYFDHNATTPLAPEVAQVITEALRSGFGNPSSVHQEGQRARQFLETARRRVARLVTADPAEIVFTSGGTESNNLAILGCARNVETGRARHVITTAIEHPSALEPCRQLEREGVEVTILPVSEDGVVDPEDVRRALRRETVLVSVMHANNETGVIQPVPEMAAIVQEARGQGQDVYLHCDGVQAPGRIPVNLETLGADLYSMSGHKLYGPKGVGVLYARKSVPLSRVQFGGRQEHAKRPGTENVTAAVAFAAALELASKAERLRQIKLLRDYFESKLLTLLDDISINGSNAERIPNTSNIYFDGVDGGSLVIALDLKGFAVSSGSACSSGSVEPSHVLIAMGKSHKKARQCVRFSMGYTNTLRQVDELADAVAAAVGQFRARRHNSSQRSVSGVPA